MPVIACEYLPKVRETVARLAKLAFDEDLPEGDATAEALHLAGEDAQARIFCREPIVMCGAAWFDLVRNEYLARYPERSLDIRCQLEDGAHVDSGSTLFNLEGDTAAIVGLERTLLNFLGRAIGIATATHAYVRRVRQYGATRIMDTRKTLPGYRYFDKYAVLCGGGANHRFSLSDQVLIKENHLSRFHGPGQALEQVRRRLPHPLPLQIEVRDQETLYEAVEAGWPLIMLDNFTPEMVKTACDLPRRQSQLEVSGGITLDNIENYCHPKLDRISIGALTHSVKAPDLSLLLEEG